MSDQWCITYRPDCTDWTWEVHRRGENYTVDVPSIWEPTCGCGQPECEHIIAVLRAKYSPMHPILQKQKLSAPSRSVLDELMTTLPFIRDRQRKHYCSLDQRRIDAGTLLKIVDAQALKISQLEQECRTLRERGLTPANGARE